MDFLKKYLNINLTEDKNTAETARRVHRKQLKKIAAIASKIAAQLYNLENFALII